MKYCIKATGFFLLLIATASNAITPKTGWFGGILLGGNYAASNDITYTDRDTLETTTGELKYSGYGNLDLHTGYRFAAPFRAELQFLLIGNKYKKITFDDGIEIISRKKTNELTFQGKTTTAALMLNGYYDFITQGSDVAPYIGAGIGYAHIKNGIKFYEDQIYVSGSRLNQSANSPAAQGIVGLSYYLDSLTWFGLDFRYFYSRQFKNDADLGLLKNPLQVASINLSFTGLIDCM
jgi:opacity protein-like surface antigen